MPGYWPSIACQMKACPCGVLVQWDTDGQFASRECIQLAEKLTFGLSDFTM